jgi:hypothetical protein
MRIAAQRASNLTSMVAFAAALAAPCAAMAAKAKPVALAYDASLLQGGDQSQQVTMQTLPQDPAQPAPKPATMTNSPDAYGASTGNNAVSYTGEVQDADPSSTNIANRSGRAASARGATQSRNIAAEPLDASGEGGDMSPAPAALLPGQLSAFGAQPIAGRPLVIRPYIEAQQVADDQLSPSGGGGLLTYSVLAVGVDALLNGRNTQGSISLRYERRFGWGKESGGNSVSGVASLSTRLTEGLRLDYGGYANRFQTSAGGATFADYNNSGDSLSQVYSVYAGPSLSTHSGDVAINGAYHAGYTKVDNQLNGASVVGINTLDHSVSQDARLAVGTKPGGLGLPVGIGVEGGWFREDISNLDQRVSDLHARAQVIVPVTPALSLLGGVGAEKVQVSSRNAVVDSSGNPVLGANGELVTDKTSPRYIAFDTSGLIWDVGAQWRPSSRISAEGHVGRRYGRLGGYGFFNWKPGSSTTFNVTAYENITGFGGALANALSGTSTQFTAIRDSITGNLSSCVGSLTGGTCIGGATGSLNSQVYRGRGVTASLMHSLGRWQVGVGGGWDRRVYIAAPETVLAELNGKVDQYYWVAGYAGGKVSARSSIQTTLELYKFESGLVANGDISAVRAVGVYQYYFSHHLTGNASLAVDGMKREQAEDLWTASGALGVRYSF